MACSSGDAGRAGSQGGLQTMSGAWPGGNRRVFGGHDPLDAPAHQQGGQHPGAGANVQGQRGVARQGLLGHQVQIFASDRRKHAVMRVNAVARRFAQHGNFDARFAPFVCPDNAQQLAQRDDGGLTGGRPPGLGNGGAPVGRAAQGDRVIGLQGDEQRAQGARALRLRLAVQVETLLRARSRRLRYRTGRRFGRLVVRAACQCLQQLAGVLEVAPPQHPSAGARQAVGAVGAQGVVRQFHAARRAHPGLTVPGGTGSHSLGSGPRNGGCGVAGRSRGH